MVGEPDGCGVMVGVVVVGDADGNVVLGLEEG